MTIRILAKNPSGLDFFASFFDQAKKGGRVGGKPTIINIML